MNQNFFSQIDWGDLVKFLNDDDVTDVSYSNGGQVWLKTLTRGVLRVDEPTINNTLMEKIAFQCSNIMGKTFNMAHPFLDAESAELRLNFVHESIATNGIACVIRKTPAKIRLNKEKLIKEDYVSQALHDFLFRCVEGHCNIIVSGETGSGKTELVKYLAAHTRENEKVITIEDTLELHLDRIFPHRDIVSMKTNNIASYSDVLVTCMRQNPRWILLSEVRSAEAVMAVRNSISSGHNIISTIHSDKASAIPMRLYSLLESNLDIDQFLKSIHRYVHIGIHVKGYMSKKLGRFQREIVEVAEFYVDDNTNEAKVNVIFKKGLDGTERYNNPSKNLIEYLSMQGVEVPENAFVDEEGNYNPVIIAPRDIEPDESANNASDGGETKTLPVEEPKVETEQNTEVKVEEKPLEQAVVAEQPKVETPAPAQEVQKVEVKEEVKPEQPVEHMIDPIVVNKPEEAAPVQEPEPLKMEDAKALVDMGSIVSDKGFEIIEEEPVKEPEPTIQVIGANNTVQTVPVPPSPAANAPVMDSTPVFNI